jgi:hypothetical protein
MENKIKDTPNVVVNDVESTKKNNDCHSTHNKLFFQPETLDGYIMAVTNAHSALDPITMALSSMRLYVEIEMFGDRLPPERRKHLIALREEIEHWDQTEGRRLLAEQLHEEQRRKRDGQRRDKQLLNRHQCIGKRR